jgi:lipooligosaccharide transport system permease protein
MTDHGAPALSLPLRVLPPVGIGRGRARHLVERNVIAYRRGWIFLVSGFFEPFFYLLSIGLGLNHLVGHLEIGGHSIAYTDYVAPGLLASSAMNGAVFDATFGIFFKLKIAKTYDAILATPLGPRDVAIGELSWSLIRGTVYSVAFLSVMAALGLVASWWAVLCLPAAMLVSFAFGGGRDVRQLLHARLAGLRPDLAGDRAAVPVLGSVLPALALSRSGCAIVVTVTPLYQGVALLRGLDTGVDRARCCSSMLAYLGLLGVAGPGWARRGASGGCCCP